MSFLNNVEIYENGKELATAVVVQAFKDYKSYKIKLLGLEEEAKLNQKKLKDLRTKITQIETFLDKNVPNLDYKTVLDNLIAEAESEYKEKKAKKKNSKNKINNVVHSEVT